ncbi:MAG: hypothetical protein JWP29_3278, partial [Rhodoferax sp.]|nr:hypothetical protein [Rhodoferax sp.]
ARELAKLRAYAGQYILFHDQHVPVEPHWWVAPRTLAFDLDYASLWRASRHGDFQGVRCRLMSAEWSLLVLCLHGTKEKWHKLKWIIDIAMFGPAHPQLDWAALQQLASQQGCLRMLDMALLLAHRLLGMALPEPFRLRVTGDAPLSQRVDDAMAQLRGEREPEPGPYHLCRAYWQARERRRDRWRYALRTVFTPRVSHYRLLPLPRVLSPLYIPIKLVWDHLLGPLRRQWRARRARRLAC